MIKFTVLTGQEQKVIIYFQNKLLLNRPGCSANPPGNKGKILIGEIIMTQIDLRSRVKPTEMDKRPYISCWLLDQERSRKYSKKSSQYKAG